MIYDFDIGKILIFFIEMYCLYMIDRMVYVINYFFNEKF